MIHLNKGYEINEEIETILEEMGEREEFHCTRYVGCPVNGCGIEDTDYLSKLDLQI